MATVANKAFPAHSKIDTHIPSPLFARKVLKDGVAVPTAIVGSAQIFVDAADGDLKVRFGDGTTKLIVADT